tara:strand:+ start:340 stop:744 length:405 start_codon:yes stop_codon:yes gene_type:complete
MFIISLILNLKKINNISITESIIYNAAINYEVINRYEDYELEGINKHIKNNNKIIILEFESSNNFINFLRFIKSVNNINIEYIYIDNNILYAKQSYINKLDREIYSKKKINEIINNNKKSNNKDIINIYKTLFN